MTVTVLITGSRRFPDRALVQEAIGTLPKGTMVIVGDADGVDRWAARDADLRGLIVSIFRVSKEDWKTLGKGAGPARNQRMVNETRVRGGRVLAFWDGESTGTADCVRRAEIAGLECSVILRRRGETTSTLPSPAFRQRRRLLGKS